MKQRTTGFPRISLSSAVKIMTDAIKMGKSWKKEQFAGFGAKSNSGSAKSGAFLARVAGLRDYGLINSDKDTVTSTDLAQRIAKPINPTERDMAIKQAFLSVKTFSELYNALDANEPLPRDKVAGHAVFNLGVSRDVMDKFINVFVDSGKYAGLVKYDKDSDTIMLIKDKEAAEVADDTISAKATGTGSDLEEVASFIKETTPKVVATVKGSSLTDGAIMNEQGVNHSGEGWGLTVLVKSSHRLPADLRKSIRDLLESADNVADSFYEIEKIGR